MASQAAPAPLQNRRNWVTRTEKQFQQITIFKVPENLRDVSMEDFKPRELRVGLITRSGANENQVDKVKQRLAILLNKKLRWEDFVNNVVPSVEDVQICYEMDLPFPAPPGSPSSCSSPAPSSTNPSSPSSPVSRPPSPPSPRSPSSPLAPLIAAAPCPSPLLLSNTASPAPPVNAQQEILALDSLFLVLYLHAANNHYVLNGSRKILASLPLIDVDLILLENQVPMSLLRRVILQLQPIDEESSTVDDKLDRILKQAVRLCYPFVHKPRKPDTFCHWLSSCFQISQSMATTLRDDPFGVYLEEKYGLQTFALTECDHILQCVYRVVCGHTTNEILDSVSTGCDANSIRIQVESLDRILPAVSMEQCSIRIQSDATTMTDIKFSTGKNFRPLRACCCGRSCWKTLTLHLPQVKMTDNTAATFRNLALYEQRARKGGDLRSYMQFMGELVNNAGDAELLRKRGVIKSLLGSDEEIVGTWTRMCHRLVSSYPSMQWESRLMDINRHCKSWYHRTRGHCCKTYCSKPDLAVSVVVLFLIFLCTLVQTYVSITSSNHLKPQFKG